VAAIHMPFWPALPPPPNRITPSCAHCFFPSCNGGLLDLLSRALDPFSTLNFSRETCRVIESCRVVRVSVGSLFVVLIVLSLFCGMYCWKTPLVRPPIICNNSRVLPPLFLAYPLNAHKSHLLAGPLFSGPPNSILAPGRTCS